MQSNALPPQSAWADVQAVAVAALPAPVEAGDTFRIGAELLSVLHAERDAAGAAWRVPCRRD
jgi:hypothetical protein